MTDDIALNLDGVLEPVSADSSCGPDLRYDDQYNRIRMDRASDPNDILSGQWKRRAKKIDWDAITGQCVQFLQTRSKDLQVCGWLVEALSFGYGLRGLTQGLHVFVELHVRYWQDVHPLLEEDAEMRLRPTLWLVQEFTNWLASDLFKGEGHETASIQRQRRTYFGWQAVRSEFLRLNVVLDEKLSDQAPSLSELLARITAEVEAHRPQAIATEVVDDQSSGSAQSMALAPETQGAFRSFSRERAYDQLAEIGAYLARVEPHSPVPIVLQGLVGWRDVPFPELLDRLPKDGPSVYELMALFKRPVG